MANSQYTVVAALVLLRQGDDLRYLYAGSPVPSDADAAQVQRLLDFGMIEPVEVDPEVDPEDEVGLVSVEPEVDDDEVDYSTMEYADLQALAKERGIAANQGRSDLIAALAG